MRLFIRFLSALMLLTACHGARQQRIYDLLDQADSAFVQGHYDVADSLLCAYDEYFGNGDAFTQVKQEERLYRQLLSLEQKYLRGEITSNDFLLADTLSRFYDSRSTPHCQARALLFLGKVYCDGGDNPSALNCFLRAEEVGREVNEQILQAWACQNIGDVYFEQRMLDECKNYYRRYYCHSRSMNDTLRMAHAAHRMGMLYTMENNVDSTVFFYKQAIEMGTGMPQADNIVPFSVSNLCDIYIQIEEFDEAKSIMPRDSLNAPNWAYWHLGQQHVDSAIYLFKNLLGRRGVRADAEYLRLLTRLETDRGNILQANRYYEKLIEAEDSSRIVSLVESMQKTDAQFNFNSILRERDKIVSQMRRSLWLLVAVVLSGFFLAVLSAFIIRRRQEQKKAEITRQRLLLNELESAHRNSMLQLEAKQHRLDEVEKQMVYMMQQRCQKEQKFRETSLYKKLHRLDRTQGEFRLSVEEWQMLAQSIDDTYDHFTSRLMSLGKFSDTDLKICYLTKAGVSPTAIAELLFKTPSAISKARKRMWKRMTGQLASPNELDSFIRNF